MYAIFEGLGMNPNPFMDFVKIYLFLGVIGNSSLHKEPI
jgi:hypothetical protein